MVICLLEDTLSLYRFDRSKQRFSAYFDVGKMAHRLKQSDSVVTTIRGDNTVYEMKLLALPSIKDVFALLKSNYFWSISAKRVHVSTFAD